MKRFLALCSALSLLGLLSCATGPSKEQQLVSKAVEALGGAQAIADIRTISWKGNLKQWEPEQSDAPGGDARFCNEAQLEGLIDVQARASRIDWVKNFAYPAPRTFTYSEIVTPAAGYVMGVDSNGRNAESQKANPPAHAMSGYRLATSQREGRRGNISGLLLDMLFNPERVQPADDIVAQGRNYPAAAYQSFIVAFDPQTGLPARVRTLDYDNIWGDVTYDVVLSDWKPVGGIKVAMNRKTELNGKMISDFNFTDVKLNQALDTKRLAIPAQASANAAKPATGNIPYQWVIRRQYIGTYLDSDNASYDTKAASPGLRLQELAPGVAQVVGGSHNSLVVEMSDFLVIFDAPVSDGQSQWTMKAAKEKFNNKPVKWVVLTHHHMDHAGGVRAMLADGGTLVVGAPARAHFQKVLAAPATRNPDLSPRSYSAVQIMEVTSSNVITDSRGRQVMMYVMDNPHAKGMMMGWVPDAKLGWITDLWSPGTPMPPKPNPALASVVNTVRTAGIQPERFAGGHGSSAPYSQLTQLVGQ
ncbi:MAG TPA: MBL fold metallo-hydrolase [Burkholderiales bacterium]|jgi:glyoxylase-like metal-dependent hydrolase (beta-lactamase superfamily II)